MGLAFENLCRPQRFCFVKVSTLVASVISSVFLLATAAAILWKRCSHRPDTPIGRLVDNLVSKPLALPFHVRDDDERIIDPDGVTIQGLISRTNAFHDQVLGLCLLDATYYLPCLLTVLQGPVSPVLMLGEHMGHATFIYPHCREAVMMLDIMFHCYVAHIMYCWIVLKVSNLK